MRLWRDKGWIWLRVGKIAIPIDIEDVPNVIKALELLESGTVTSVETLDMKPEGENGQENQAAPRI